MRYKYSSRHKTGKGFQNLNKNKYYSNDLNIGFIYGVPPNPNEHYALDVVATNKANYETGILKLVVNVTSLSPEIKYHEINNVKLKIDNLNLVI